MPELPEVQTVVNDLITAGLIGRTILDVHIFWPGCIAEPATDKFIRTIQDQSIKAIERRGKYIIFILNDGRYLLIHLRMSGRLFLSPPEVLISKHEHCVIDFSGGLQLRFHDTRKFGRIFLLDDPSSVLNRLGPEPFAPGFTARMFTERLLSRKRLLKPLLLDQGFIAGLGNIYVDEALWDARLHPCRTASDLSRKEARTLFRSIQKVLRQGIENLGTTLGNGQANFRSVQARMGSNRQELKVFRRTGLPCPRCHNTIERIIVGQRSTHICPRCQKA